MTTHSDTGTKRPSRASEHLRRANFRRRVERAYKSAALRELGLARPSAEVIPLPRIDGKSRATDVPPGGAKILIFTGIRREFWN